MGQRSGVCTRRPPRGTAHSPQLPRLFPSPPPRASSQSLLLGGLTYLLLTRSVSLSCPGITRKLVTEAGSASRHQGSFPGSHAPPARPLPAQTQKGPLGPEPHGSAWAPTSSCLVRPSHVPCRVTRSSHLLQAGCLLCPGEASVVSGGRHKRYPWGLPHTAQWPAPTYSPHHSGWMGSGGLWHLLVLISSQRRPQGSC